MLNVLPFVVGLVAGAAAVSALRAPRAQAVMHDAGARLRTAYGDAHSSVRQAACSGMERLCGTTDASAPPATATTAAAAPPQPVEPVVETAETAEVKPAARPRAARAPRRPKSAPDEV